MYFSSSHRYLNDLVVGQEWTSAGRTLTEADIVNFAGFSGDFNPIHMDHEFAKTTPFGRPLVHGFGVFAVASGLAVSAPPVRTIALVRVHRWEFRRPVFVGDTIRCHSRVAQITITGRGQRGGLTWHRQVWNQADEVVQEGELLLLVECRPPQTPRERPGEPPSQGQD